METTLKVLLRDYGYVMKEDTLIEKACPPFSPARVVGKFKNILAAVEYLCPIVKRPDFSFRLQCVHAQVPYTLDGWAKFQQETLDANRKLVKHPPQQ